MLVMILHILKTHKKVQNGEIVSSALRITYMLEYGSKLNFECSLILFDIFIFEPSVMEGGGGAGQ